MQNSKRIQRLQKKLSHLQDIVSYYTNGSKDYNKDFNDIRELIDELAMDKKEDHQRLAKKLKGIWKAEDKTS